MGFIWRKLVMKIEVSNGEIVDKLTIIEIKLEKIKDPEKVENLRKEYKELEEAVRSILNKDHTLYKQLLEVNNKLWRIEDHLRELEKKKDFENDFIQTARSVYFFNDERAALKRKINILTESAFYEEKGYSKYT